MCTAETWRAADASATAHPGATATDARPTAEMAAAARDVRCSAATAHAGAAADMAAAHGMRCSAATAATSTSAAASWRRAGSAGQNGGERDNSTKLDF